MKKEDAVILKAKAAQFVEWLQAEEEDKDDDQKEKDEKK